MPGRADPAQDDRGAWSTRPGCWNVQADMDRKAHWESIYTTRGETDVSWFQPDPALSLELIRSVAPERGRVIDVGGGASRLVDRLIESGFALVAVLDISGAALDRARARLGGRADAVRWIEADVTVTSAAAGWAGVTVTVKVWET